MSERCYKCFRPVSLCFCHEIPQVNNRTDVLILQHVAERFHPFNTARIVQQALRQCRVMTDHNRRLRLQPLPIHPRAGLLYPSANAPLLSELSHENRPTQLVIVDGTWHQSKTIVRDVQQLWRLPRYRLAPPSPGRYRIRREPAAHCLSTLEATVAALRALEPETIGLQQLLSAFNKMIERQLEFPTRRFTPRRRKPRSRPRHLPQALARSPNDLVIAYGEATPHQLGQTRPTPVNWVAQRLGTGDRFSCLLRQQVRIPDAALAHMGLRPGQLDQAVSEEEFNRRWEQFVRQADVLVVYHQKTFDLLQRVTAWQPPCLVLKSICKQVRSDFRSLEELLAAEGLEPDTGAGNCRADFRLNLALTLVEHLRAARRS